MKKTLYIHIGRPKVASTAIQRFLKTNRDVLLSQGVLYPRTGERQNASHRLCDVLAAEVARVKGARQAAEELYTELYEEVQSSPASAAIVSTENFYLMKPKLLASRLADRFDVKIVCYIRRQDEVLVSSYIQEMRDDSIAEAEARDLDLYLSRPDRLRLLDYCENLAPWSAAFGQENILVRVFEQGQLKGDVYGDILHVLGLGMDDRYTVPVQRVNSSPGTDVLRLIRNLNAYPTSPLIRTQLKSSLVEASENLPRDDRFDTRRIFSYEQRAAALAHFTQSNADTARQYLGRKDGMLFREAIDAPRRDGGEVVSLDGSFEPDRLAQIFVGVLVAQQREINRISILLERMREDALVDSDGNSGGQ